MPSVELAKKTNQRGSCTIAVTNASLLYMVTVELEGYEPAEGEVQPRVDKTTEKVIIMAREGTGATSETVMTAAEREKYIRADRELRRYNEGVELQKAGDLDGAMAKYRESAETNGTFAPAFTGIAMVAIEQKNFQEAAEAAEKAVAIEPTNYQALLVRYDAYRLGGDSKKAENAAKALKEAGDVSEAANRIFHEAVAAFNAGDVDGAQAGFQQAVSLDPELVQAYANLAQIYLKQGNMARAAAMATEVLELRPGDVTALKVRYAALIGIGDTEGTRETLSRLVKADPEWAAANLLDHATELFNGGRTEEAAVVLVELLEVQPDHPEAHYLLGLCLNSTSDVAGAKSHLERFLELAPDHPQAESAREILNYMQ
jgi:tetratricopeptide (TPR) repeat protein